MEDDKRTDYEMDISGENSMFQNCSISINKLDENIDSTISSAYTYDTGSLHTKFSSNFEKDFANDLS